MVVLYIAFMPTLLRCEGIMQHQNTVIVPFSLCLHDFQCEGDLKQNEHERSIGVSVLDSVCCAEELLEDDKCLVKHKHVKLHLHWRLERGCASMHL